MAATVRRKVYVVGGYIPNGGTYMAYYLGYILHTRFDIECIITRIGRETSDNGVFDYPKDFEAVDLPTMQSQITDNDILIANPSFSSHLFGLRLPGRKIMYIQGFHTFGVLDGFFDHYVCVSEFVHGFVQMVYGLQPPVIPAFIHTDRIPVARTWKDRPPRQVLVLGKVYCKELLEQFRLALMNRHPDLNYVFEIPDPMRHSHLIQRMSEHRYVLILSPCEGFGLMPLEAMACGCTVFGFHGCGGSEFMKPAVNCQVVGYPRIDLLVEKTANILRSPAVAERLAQQGAIDARQYDYNAFEARWTQYFTNVVGL